MMVLIGKEQELLLYMEDRVLKNRSILWILFMTFKFQGNKRSLPMGFRILTLFILLAISIPYLTSSNFRSNSIVM